MILRNTTYFHMSKEFTRRCIEHLSGKKIEPEVPPTSEIPLSPEVKVIDGNHVEIAGKKYVAARPDRETCPVCKTEYSALNRNGLCFQCDFEFNRSLYDSISDLRVEAAKIKHDQIKVEQECKDLRSKVYLLSMMLKSVDKEGIVETVEKILGATEQKIEKE